MISREDKTTEDIMPTSIVKDDKQVLTTDAVSSEKIDTENREEVIPVDIVPEESVAIECLIETNS
jgi:hypothetical protein